MDQLPVGRRQGLVQSRPEQPSASTRRAKKALNLFQKHRVGFSLKFIIKLARFAPARHTIHKWGNKRSGKQWKRGKRFDISAASATVSQSHEEAPRGETSANAIASSPVSL